MKCDVYCRKNKWKFERMPVNHIQWTLTIALFFVTMSFSQIKIASYQMHWEPLKSKKNVLLKLNINNKRRTHIKNVHITFSKYNKVLGWLNVKCNKNVFRVDFNGKLEWLIYWTIWKYGRTIDGLTQHLFAFTRIYTSNHNCYI